MTYFLLLCAVLGSSFQSVFAKLYGKNSDSTSGNSLFNLVKSSAMLLFSLTLVGSFTALHTPTTIYAVIFGISLALSMSFGYLALCLGPLSLTSLIVSYSLIIPIAVGIAFLDEKVTPFMSVGFALLIASLFLINTGKSAKSESKLSGKWAICVAVTFLTNGVCSTVQKLHQNAYPNMYKSEFTIFYSLITVMIFAIIFLSGRKNAEHKIQRNCKGVLFAALAGASNIVMNYLVLYLSSEMPSTLLFPLMSALTMIAACLFSRFMFGSKLTKRQLSGILLGIASLVFLKMQ